MDGDGFGDETQDGCPTDATTQGPCPPPADIEPPETEIVKRPRDNTTRPTVSFRFTSDEIGSTFECKLDKKPFRACASPKELRVKKGRHRFKVRAIDPAGNVDPTAATDWFKVGG